MGITPRSDGDVDPEELDQLLHALASEYRRLVIAYFEESPAEEASLDDLVRSILVFSRSQDEPEVPSPDQVRVRLHHADLPRLSEVGLIDYDAASNTVRYRGIPEGSAKETWVHHVIDTMVE